MWHWAGSCWWDTLPGPWKQENVLEQLLCVTAVTQLFNCRQEHGRDSAAQSCQCCREPHLPLLEKETLTSTKGTLNQAVIQDSAFTPQCSAVGLFQMWWAVNGKLQSSWTPSPLQAPCCSGGDCRTWCLEMVIVLLAYGMIHRLKVKLIL